MKISKVWQKSGAALLVMLALVSCQEDLSTIGSEILGSEIPNGILDESHSIKAYSKKWPAVQTNAMSSYGLGIYKDATYGTARTHLVSQLSLPKNSPQFGEGAEVDSVFVYLPYFSKETVSDSSSVYTLDSIFGTKPFKISILESKYYLRAFDPQDNFESPQLYYSNQQEAIENYLGEEIASVDNFKPSKKGYVFYKGENNEEKLAPGLRIALSKTFFQERILDKEGSTELSSNQNFRNYLRGLYFKVETDDGDGSYLLFNPENAHVRIYYSIDSEEGEEREKKTFDLGMASGVRFNIFENDPLPQYIKDRVTMPDSVNGEENLFLRGGEGLVAIVDLFGEDLDNNGVADELELLRSKKWLINEANLTFHVDQDLLQGGQTEPERIMIYNYKTGVLLQDYFVDATSGLPAANAFSEHFGRLERDSDRRGKSYKLRITNHISNVINKDSTNVPLAVVVSQNVKDPSFNRIQGLDKTKRLPAGSVLSPQGTILHGTKSANEEKRLKLQIYYTEPK